MNWIELQSIEQAKELINSSTEKPVLFFKHSVRCSISSMAKDRLERKWNIDDSKVAPIYLDLLNHRDVSNFLATELNVEHQSPQVILVKNKMATYSETHSMISVNGISEEL
ncbi:MAG: bacillithiol system redox-active protein YtxJ [Bacteroidia bacterium]|jgi:bacillithiol system protein YtxJ